MFSGALLAISLSVAYSGQAPRVVPVGCNSSTDVYSSCEQDFSNALRTLTRQNSDPERAQTAGDAVRRCIQCASDKARDEIQHFSTGGQRAQQ